MSRVALVALVALALGLSACGKRPRFLKPPDEAASTYPKRYPPPDDPDTHL